MKKRAAVFLSGAMTLITVLAFPVTSFAKTLSAPISLVEQHYPVGGGYTENPSGISKAVVISTANDDMEIKQASGLLSYADEYLESYRSTHEGNDPDGWTYYGMVGVALGVTTIGSFSAGDTVTFYLPVLVKAVADSQYDASDWTLSIAQDSATLTLKEGVSGKTNCYIELVHTPDSVAATQSETYFWVVPLKEKLNVAVSSSDAAKKVVNYTGDFALPAEIMQFLKDHPEITLKYSFVLNGENKTATLSGNDIVIDSKINWYGLEYLWANYGQGVAKADAATGEYIVVSGDTLSKIAAKFGTTVSKLAAKNGIKDVNYIYAGQKIVY